MTTLASELPAQAERTELSPIMHTRPIDEVAAASAAASLLEALGLDPDAENLSGTPHRMARMFAELLTPEPLRPTTFPNDAGYDELVLVAAGPPGSTWRRSGHRG